MRLKRIVVLILICTVLTGCGKKNPTEKKTEEKVEEKVEEKIEEKTGQNTEVYKVTVQGAIFGGASDDRIETEVSYNPEWITENDNTKYNKDLAQFAAILSDDVYFRTKDLDKDTQNRVLYEGENEEEYEWTSFLKHIGFSEIKDTAACEILTLLMNHATGLNGGHLLVNSYVLAGLGQP